MCREIPLTKGMVAIVDEADFEWLSRFKWCASKGNSGEFYAVRNLRKGSKPRQVLMHREIISAQERELVDHRNHDTLDNRRENLRKATKQQNQSNQRPQNGRTSAFKGVCWDVAGKKWRAYIVVNKRQYSLGRFGDEKSAAAAYNHAAMELHGEFAYINNLEMPQ